MKVLVTGGSGFVGLPTAVALRDRGHDVTVVGRSASPPEEVRRRELLYRSQDLTDSRGVQNVVQECAPDTVVHLAWYTNPSDYLGNRRENFASLASGVEILLAAERVGSAHVVVVGTCLEQAATAVDTVYMRAKRLLHDVALEFREPSATVATCAHLFSVYGPREHPDRAIPSIIRTLDQGDPFFVSSPESLRDYVHVEDVASALAVIAEQRPGGQVDVCVGSGAPQRLTFELLAEILGRRGLLSLAPTSRPDGKSYDVVGDPTVVRGLGWKPRYTLETGLRSTVEWWRRAPAATRE